MGSADVRPTWIGSRFAPIEAPAKDFAKRSSVVGPARWRDRSSRASERGVFFVGLVARVVECDIDLAMRWPAEFLSSRRVATALGVAVLLHGGGVLYGAKLPAHPVLPMALRDVEPFWEIEFADEAVAKPPRDQSLGAKAAGGGSIDKGSASASKPLAAMPKPSAKPVSVAQKVARENLQRPAPVTGRTDPPADALPAEAADEVDLFALDSALASESGKDAVALRTRPVAVRAQIARSHAAAPDRVRPTVASQRVEDSAAFGLGRGRDGGRGGKGSGFGDGRGSFGGASGHFRGQVCFIEPGTKALRHLGMCNVQGEFFTDVFNVTPRSFTAGFPGVSERTEWFAILYTGTVTTTEPGEYRFRVVSDDGAILRIDGEVVVDNDGQHGPVSAGALQSLEPGIHQFELRYFQGPRTTVALQVFVTPPGKTERLLRGVL